MISSGSSKDFCICCSYDISSGTKWIPRSQNDRADFLRRTYDSDDSAFLPRTDPTWGPHSIDRFANHLNAKLSRFNSRFWNRVVEGIDAFVRIRPGKIIMSVRLFTLFCAFCFISVIVSFRVSGYPFVAFRPFLANDLPSWKLVCSDN